MILAEVPVVGPYTTTNGRTGATTTWPAEALADKNLNSFVTVNWDIGPTTSLSNDVRGRVATGGVVVADDPMVRVWMRMVGRTIQDASVTNSPDIGGALLTIAGAGETSGMDLEPKPGLKPPPEWDFVAAAGLESHDVLMDSNATRIVRSAANGYNVTCVVSALSTRQQVNWRTDFMEIWLIVVLLGSDAPPCRLTGRGDDLGIGAGRIYPPTKSRQRSLGRIDFH